MDGRDVDLHPRSTARRRLTRGAGEAGTTEILNSGDETSVEEVEASLEKPLLLEGVADLNTGPLVAVVCVVVESRRGENGHAANSVATRARTQQHRQVAGAARLAEDQSFDGQDAHGEDVDEGVATVGLVEHHLTAHCGDADAVAIPRHTAHDTLGDPPRAGVVQRTEPKRVHHGDGSSPHREDVAQDPTDSCGRPLIRLDRRGVVVALDPDGNSDAVADVDDAGVLTGTDQHPWRFGRKPFEVLLG